MEIVQEEESPEVDAREELLDLIAEILNRRSAEESPSRMWEALGDLYMEKGHFAGVPLGTFDPEARIITNDPAMQKLVREAREKEGLPAYTSAFNEGDEDEEYVVHRVWHSARRYGGVYGDVVVFRNKTTGKYEHMFIPTDRNLHQRRLRMLFATVGARTWSLVKAEFTAMKRLLEVLSRVQQERYILAGAFIETGKSGVKYLFQKNRPTIAFRVEKDDHHFLPLCALCLHPLGYYDQSWAGLMAPSDEVFAHLVMMRADEHTFWKKANQISIGEPNSGV